MENIKETIRVFIISDILQKNDGGNLRDDDQLIESGIIDSLGIMTMLSFLEDRFAIQIEGDDLIPENFSSINSIAALIERRQDN